MEVSVVVPVFNAEANLPELIARLDHVLAESTTRYELVFVNDGSSDGSWAVLSAAARARDNLVAIDAMRNYGQHNALLCGIRAARYGVIVTLDDDLQHPPEEIPALLAALTAERDVVYGTPRTRQHGLLRWIASVVTKWTLEDAMGSIARQVGAFRAFRAELRQAFRDYAGSFVSIDVLLTWGTSRFGAVPVRHEPRARGVSGYTWRKLITHAFNMLTGFTTWPLQLASLLGFTLTFFGIAVLLFVVGRYLLEGTPTPGFPFLASIIAIFSGAQLFALGIMGEYLARMHFRMMQRPTYVIRDSAGPPHV